MALSFRETRELSLISICTNLIDEKTFTLLYNANSSNNLDFPYDNFDKLDLDNLCDDEGKTDLKFNKNNIFKHTEVVQIVDQLYCHRVM